MASSWRRAAAARLRDDRSMTVIGWVLYVLVIGLLLLENSTYYMYLAGLTIIYAVAALSLDWIQGRAGQVSIGTGAFIAVGGYSSALAVRANWPLIPSLIVAALAGAVVGFIVGLPALRLRGLYLALATLALQFIVVAIGAQLESSTGSSAGFLMPEGHLAGLTFFVYNRTYLIALALILALVMIGFHRLYRRAPGRAWLTVKESEMAAAVIGLNPTSWKLTAFIGSSAVTGFAGGLLAYYTHVVSSENFTLNFAITFVVMVIIGGVGSMGGVVIGAAIVTLSPSLTPLLTDSLPSGLFFTNWLNTNIFYINTGLFGIVVLLFLLYKPRGIGGAIEDTRRWLIKRLEGRPTTPREEAEEELDAQERAAKGTSEESVQSVPGEATAVTASANANDVILNVERLSVVYRTGARAVDEIDLEVRQGEIVALLGRNGAGKTSTLRAISGFFVSESVRIGGRITLEGKQIQGFSPVATSHLGVVLVPEREKVFPNLTVAEHFRVVKASSSAIDEAMDLFPSLRARSSSQAGLLSGGERQMLALGVAFCMQPKILLIDELSLGLAPVLINRLVSTLKEYQTRTHVPVLLVEQNIGAALEIADRVYIIEGGQIDRSGDASEISREVLISSSLGV